MYVTYILEDVVVFGALGISSIHLGVQLRKGGSMECAFTQPPGMLLGQNSYILTPPVRGGLVTYTPIVGIWTPPHPRGGGHGWRTIMKPLLLTAYLTCLLQILIRGRDHHLFPSLESPYLSLDVEI